MKSLKIVSMIPIFFCLSLQAENQVSETKRFAINLCNYDHKLLSAPPEFRTKRIPSFLLKYLKEIERADAYSQYWPTDSEKQNIYDAFRSLPKGLSESLDRRMLLYFFTKDLSSNGLAINISGPNTENYTILLFHPRVLIESPSSIITQRERTIYKAGKQENNDFTININTSEFGFQYILLHEASHVVSSITKCNFSNRISS